MGDVKLDVEGDIMPAFSNYGKSFLNQAWCQSSNVYDFMI